MSQKALYNPSPHDFDIVSFLSNDHRIRPAELLEKREVRLSDFVIGACELAILKGKAKRSDLAHFRLTFDGTGHRKQRSHEGYAFKDMEGKVMRLYGSLMFGSENKYEVSDHAVEKLPKTCMYDSWTKRILEKQTRPQAATNINAMEPRQMYITMRPAQALLIPEFSSVKQDSLPNSGVSLQKTQIAAPNTPPPTPHAEIIEIHSDSDSASPRSMTTLRQQNRQLRNENIRDLVAIKAQHTREIGELQIKILDLEEAAGARSNKKGKIAAEQENVLQEATEKAEMNRLESRNVVIGIQYHRLDILIEDFVKVCKSFEVQGGKEAASSMRSFACQMEGGAVSLRKAANEHLAENQDRERKRKLQGGDEDTAKRICKEEPGRKLRGI